MERCHVYPPYLVQIPKKKNARLYEAEDFQPAGDDGSPLQVGFLAAGWLGSAAARGPAGGQTDLRRREHTNEAIRHFLWDAPRAGTDRKGESVSPMCNYHDVKFSRLTAAGGGFGGLRTVQPCRIYPSSVMVGGRSAAEESQQRTKSNL